MAALPDLQGNRMEEHGRRTIMCSVFFLDIVEYAKKPVAEQIALKDRFNGYLSAAIRDVPVADRIILDTGDGAAINFLGDIDDALKAALSLREKLLTETAGQGSRLLVRMGINLGPVRLVRDSNGQPSIVGDGMNVAQRIMGFADAAQILVSRSFYDAVSRLSPQYAGMFHYQGSRTDKHVREHEVYAIGYPGDVTTYRGVIASSLPSSSGSLLARWIWRARGWLRFAASRTDDWLENALNHYQRSGSIQRGLYVGIMIIVPLLLIAIVVNLARREELPVSAPVKMERQVAAVHAASSVLPVVAVRESQDAGISGVPMPQAQGKAKPRSRKDAAGRNLAVPREGEEGHAKTAEPSVNKVAPEPAVAAVPTATSVTTTSDDSNARVVVSCREGTEVFVDGDRKGRIEARPLNIILSPGEHTVIVSHTIGGIYTQKVDLSAGKMVHIKPSFCDQH
jgi:class 3 adenylate cyclase